jgi:hypothetical protein
MLLNQLTTTAAAGAAHLCKLIVQNDFKCAARRTSSLAGASYTAINSQVYINTTPRIEQSLHRIKTNKNMCALIEKPTIISIASSSMQ